MKTVFVDRVRRFALEVDEESGRTFDPGDNEYCGVLGVVRGRPGDIDRFAADPRARQGSSNRRNRELDHLLLFPPGRLRGET